MGRLFLGVVTADEAGDERLGQGPSPDFLCINGPVCKRACNRPVATQKAPQILFAGLSSRFVCAGDSYRISVIQSFAIMIKCITFVYQRITVVNSLWIATEFC